MPTAKQVTITVKFKAHAHGPDWTFTGGNLPGSSSADGQGYTVVWQLAHGSSPGTSFAANAIQWEDDDAPPDFTGTNWTPPANVPAPNANVYNDITNTNGPVKTFGYTITVMYQNKPYSSTDPEVVLQPPGSGGGDDDEDEDDHQPKGGR
jgi:hypothetical protein